MTDTAIILAGGMGTRLQSVVNNLPKPMAPVIGQPFLNYLLRYLKHYGIKKIILSVGHLHEKITSFYGNKFCDMEIVYSREQQALGTGGGIRLAFAHCNHEEALVLNGDSLFDINLFEFYKQHTLSDSKISLSLRTVSNASRYGTIITDTNNNIISFAEKSGHNLPGKINAGIYLLCKTVFLNNTIANSTFSIEKDFFEKQLTHLPMRGFEFSGYFIDIGIPEDYLKVQHDFKRFKYK